MHYQNDHAVIRTCGHIQVAVFVEWMMTPTVTIGENFIRIWSQLVSATGIETVTLAVLSKCTP